MTTSTLETRTSSAWDEAADWIADVLDDEGLGRARTTLGLRTVHRLDLRVDGRLVATVDLDGDLAQTCGVSVAAALLERQARGDCGTWELSVSVHEEDVGAEVLVREWRCPDRAGG